MGTPPMISFGFDYGTRPIVPISGDVKFLDLLNRGFLGLGYGVVPEFGLLVEPPALFMEFNNGVTARECFSHFAEWGDGDGDAVRIAFVDLNDGGFGICISQETDLLLRQRIDQIYRDEIEPRIMVVGHLKSFPNQSDGYKWFKSAALASPFVLAPSVDGGPIKELALRKRQINCYVEEDVPEDSIESLLIKSRSAKAHRNMSRPIPGEFRFTKEGIAERRRVQLSRFFPVTIERLEFSESFNQVKTDLISEGFRSWQIVQAACNLSLQYVVPELFIDDVGIARTSHLSTTLDVLKFLLDNFQSLSFPNLPEDCLTNCKMKEQIKADSTALLNYVQDKLVRDYDASTIQDELVRESLLDTL